MKTNLLLLDTLKNMENLIYSGFSLSNELKRKLKIVYVYDFGWIGNSDLAGLGTTAPNIDASLRIVKREFRKDFEMAESQIRKTVADYLAKYPQNIPYEIEVKETSKLLLVDQVLEDEKDVLLLMSNYNSYSKVISGEMNYPNVIDQFPCPVLIVPDDIKNIALNNCLYATAFHSEDLIALDHLVSLFNGGDEEKITIFHNNKQNNFESQLEWTGFQEMVCEKLKDAKLDFVLSHEKDVRHGLKTIVEKMQPDLIVILKEEKGFFEELFSGSETHYVVTHFNKPVLVYHEKNLK